VNTECPQQAYQKETRLSPVSGKQAYVWVDNQESLAQMLAQLHEASVIAVDTEANSLFAYFEKVCLLQFSIEGMDFLVDPLSVDVTPLGKIFASQQHEIVFHAAEYDVMCLKRDYNFQFNNLFDTMIAARLLGWKRYGLGPILEDRFNVHLNKSLQRYNWGQRPLSEEALSYARLDTHYLLPLREMQQRELRAMGRLTEAYKVSQRQTRVEPAPKTFDPDGFWRVKGARDLSPQQQAVLREIFILRDKLARNMDRPPFKVLSNAAMVSLATRLPASRRELDQIKGLSHKIRKQHAHNLLQAIIHGLDAPPPRYPRSTNCRRDMEAEANYELLRSWRNELAQARDVEPDIILTNHALMELAYQAPHTQDTLAKVEALDDWQRDTYGSAILKVLNGRTR
jgi:ribonuclease D